MNLSLKLRPLWHRDRLDHELARGIDPAGSEQLTLRAQQLLRRRAELAADIETVLERADQPIGFTVEVPVRRAAVRDCTDDLRALVRRLRDDDPVDVRGAAMAWNLLTDGASPLYLNSGEPLRYAVRAARLALDPVELPVHEVATAA